MNITSLHQNKDIRINAIYDILRHSSVTMSELSDMFDVSTKTIQRDYNEILKFNGIVKDGRKLCFDPNFDMGNLNSMQKTVLGILDEMAKNVGGEFYGRAHTLLSQISSQIDHHIFTNYKSETLSSTDIDKFIKFEQIIKDKCIASFTYNGHKYYVKSLKLAFFDGYWYLLVLDKNDNDKFKKFHIKSISDIEKSGEIFEIDSTLDERLKMANSIWFQLENEPFDVRLHVDNEYVKYFERRPLRTQSITGKDADGSIEVTVTVTYKMEIIPLILSSIPYVRTLEPQWLADEVKKSVKKYLKSI